MQTLNEIIVANVSGGGKAGIAGPPIDFPLIQPVPFPIEQVLD